MCVPMHDVAEVFREFQIGRHLGAGNHRNGDALVMDQFRVLRGEFVVEGDEYGAELKRREFFQEFGVLQPLEVQFLDARCVDKPTFL
jgi:hypothetical protein